MCSTNFDDFDEWGDVNKLREEVEAQKARVESLQSEQNWIKNSYSASDLYGKTRLDRSDSGIDRQSLLMDNCRETGCDSSNNVSLQECSANSIKKIIEITSLIRAIEQQLNVVNNFNDNDSIKTYSSTCSMPKCIHELPEPSHSNDSWIHNQLISSAIEQERLNKQLSHLNNQLFKIENLKIPNALNGITNEQLKKKISDYYKLKSILAELATNSSSSSAAMINVVKQLEPLAYAVEQYFTLSQEVKNIHKQINMIIERKASMLEKRSQLSKMMQLSNNQKLKMDLLPQSISWNQSPQCNLSSLTTDHIEFQRPVFPKHSSIRNIVNNKLSIQSDENEFWKNVYWPSFNGGGIAEEFPPSFDECMTKLKKKSQIEHNRKICHEYVNDDVIASQNHSMVSQNIDLMLSSFPLESIIIIQVRGFKLSKPLQCGRQYRARIQQLNGEGSDWHTICLSDSGNRGLISPHILLPIKWNFKGSNISLFFEIQILDPGIASNTVHYMFNVIPESSVQNISVAMHTIQSHVNISNGVDVNSSYMDLLTSNSLKLQPTSTIFDDAVSENWVGGMHLTKNVIYNKDCPPIHYSNIRRSKTYSHDHQYCGNFECCSSIDLVSEPIQKISQKFTPPDLSPSHNFRNFDKVVNSPDESGCVSSNSSFKRQSPFRQPIRLKKNPSIRNINSNDIHQMSEFQYNDQLIKDLWSVVFDLYLALNSCSNHDERLLEFAYFKKRCPSNLMKLYEYFVETIFDSDK